MAIRKIVWKCGVKAFMQKTDYRVESDTVELPLISPG